MFVSAALHLGVAALAYGFLMRPPEGLPPGGVIPIEVEVISADVFDAAFSEAGAGSASDLPIPDVALPPIPHPVSDLELLPLPDVPPPVTDIELLPVPETVPAPDFADQLASPISPSRESPPEPAAAPTLPSPRAAKAAPPTAKVAKPVERAQSERQNAARGSTTRGTGEDAFTSHAASRGVQSQGGSAGAGAFESYRSRVMGHLARYKRYPEAARVQGLYGRALVTFALDKTGNVTGVSLARPSAHSLLDREALAMVRRASPFPPIPPETGQASASFTAPIRYDMN
ncbi:MAG: TonB family protein [Microvirga sp.]|jgi:TonB family protein|nr:TonB family protein [Microvirga sp.]